MTHFPPASAGDLPADLSFHLPEGPARRTRRWVARTAVPGPARAISVAQDGSCAVAYAAPWGAPDTDCEVRVLSGPDLATVVARYPELRAPAALSPDGRLLAAAEVTRPPFQRSSLSPGLRLITLCDPAPSGGAVAGVFWPLRALFGWLPPRGEDSGVELAAFTRHPHKRPPVGDTTVSPTAVADLLALERDEARLVVADVTKETVTPLARCRELLDTIYLDSSSLAVPGDGAMVVVAAHHRVLGFRRATGEVAWIQPLPGRPGYSGSWNTSAASPCGRLTALAAKAAHATVNLVILDTATGRTLLSLHGGTLGASTAPTALCFHPAGWLAVGFGDGRVAHLTLTGSHTVYRALSRAVFALAFTADGSTLLAGGGDRQGLRAVPLTPQERNPLSS